MNALWRVAAPTAVALAALAATVTVVLEGAPRPAQPNVTGSVTLCADLSGCGHISATIRFVPGLDVPKGTAPVVVTTVAGRYAVALAPGDWSFHVDAYGHALGCRGAAYSPGFTFTSFPAPPRSWVAANGPLIDDLTCDRPR